MSLHDLISAARRSQKGGFAQLVKSRPLIEIEDGHALAHAIVDTIREPLLVLDKNLRVVVASRSFYTLFKMDQRDVEGRPVYALGNGQWNIPELRSLLDRIVPRHAVMDGFEVEQEYSGIGRRTMLLNARKVFYERDSNTTILLAIEDITARRVAERELAELLQQKETLLQEMQHRVGNSLQIIASILLLKARVSQSEETRLHLREAHQRVMSVATLQQHLQGSGHGEAIALGPYLSRLCKTLTASMIGERGPISLEVHAEAGSASSDQAVSIGLIVTELVINALKHAFSDDKADGQIIVAYEAGDASWKLTVSDNGIGKPGGALGKSRSGLGTSIVEALAKQLDARVEISPHLGGRTVSIIHGSFASSPPPLEAYAGKVSPAGVSVRRDSALSKMEGS
jgi:two-component sensor histidine kinase